MNKSEELAKLLGIEPKKEIAMHCGTNCNRHNCIMDKDCEHYKPIGAYPNFVKPSNFVKLLEMLFRTDSWLLDRGLNYTENENSFVGNFITELIFEVKNRPNNYKITQVKHQAQQTEWEY